MDCSAGALIVGARGFQGAIPLRSRAGNTLTKYVFRFLTGRRLTDTQSGLRGIPRRAVPRLMRLEGERYEYEMNVLADAASSCGIVEVPIETIYIEGNRSSHFHPLWDSMRIYATLARFYASALVAAVIDLAVFALAYWATSDVLAGVAAGRLSSVANFLLNRRFVFDSGGEVLQAVSRYYALVLLVAAASYSGIQILSRALGMNVLASKILVDAMLSLASFLVQRAFVFKRRPTEPPARLA
jgi:putative flippase GtrA